jgi:hypothetical protein
LKKVLMWLQKNNKLYRVFQQFWNNYWSFWASFCIILFCFCTQFY